MNSMEGSPKAMGRRAEVQRTDGDPTPFGSFSLHFSTSPPFDDDRQPSLSIITQPTMTDLIQDQIVLDPATPRTPKHQQAEQVMTSGDAAKVLKRHMDAVVKVHCVHAKPNFELPWQRKQQNVSKSTGFAVKSAQGTRWLLTNAHSVSYATQVQLKRRGDDEKYPAKVLAIGTECDIALLEVTDPEFWDDMVPLELSADLPALQESVAVLGYPIGGDSLAISAGVVSRVQMTHYSHGSMTLLAVQTDASINSGNSGGPVINAKGHCVGIAFQSLTGDANNIGYVIPTSVVRHFIDDFSRHGRYTGFPSLNIVWQEMESRILKAAYGLDPHKKGVLIRSVTHASHEAVILQPDDIILRIDGIEIGSDGSVPFRHGERVDFKYIVTQKFVGDDLLMDILRDGDVRQVTVNLQPYQYLIPAHLNESKPTYLIVGGLVFTSASDPYLIQRYGSLSNAPVRLLSKTYFGVRECEHQEIVVLSNVLACEATRGYEGSSMRDSAVLAFNGVSINNLAHLAHLVSSALKSEKYLRFDLENSNKVIILETQAAKECTEKVLDEHNITSAMSKDLMRSST